MFGDKQKAANRIVFIVVFCAVFLLSVFRVFFPDRFQSGPAALCLAVEEEITGTDGEDEHAEDEHAEDDGQDSGKDDGDYETYVVERGDSLYWIAGRYGMSVGELGALNELESDRIQPGQSLRVPSGMLKTYPVGLQLSSHEVEWLAQMIHAEARGEPYLGQVAVGAVIINRILSSQFPNTLQGVLFQTNAFQPVKNGSFYRVPNENARKAALEALGGHDPTGGALYFFNPRHSTDSFMHSRSAVQTIGGHRFTN